MEIPRINKFSDVKVGDMVSTFEDYSHNCIYRNKEYKVIDLLPMAKCYVVRNDRGDIEHIHMENCYQVEDTTPKLPDWF